MVAQSDDWHGSNNTEATDAMNSMKYFLLTLLILSTCFELSWAQEARKGKNIEGNKTAIMEAFAKDQLPPVDYQAMAATPCVAGMAGAYPCNEVDLMAFMPLSTIGGGSGNDIWGWTNSSTGKEYALMGRTSGTAFVDISDPENPVYLGNLPTHTNNSSWRDIKVYADHAFIVSEASNHGMQIFDLTQLESVVSPPQTFSNSAHYSGFGSAHNIVINEDSGFAYGVGTNTCSGGLHMVDISTPTSPSNSGCFSSDGYTHDAQCVIYNGPDTEHQGQEICFNSNEDTVTIVDVTNKTTPVQISRTGYPTRGYTHQGWLSEDHEYFFLDDELDEGSVNTRTYVWDVMDLDDPVIINTHTATIAAIDHNLYTKGDLMYQTNYRAGLRIYDISDPSDLDEIGFFDIYPGSDSPNFNGAWSNYPYFDSGIVIVSGIEQGLFILRPITDDLRLSKDAEMSVVNGQELEYTLSAFNDTPGAVTNVVITDDLPTNTSYVAASASDGGSESGGTVSFPSVSITAGQTITRTFRVKVEVPGLGGGPAVFSDDMESGSSQWTESHDTGTADFALGTTSPHGGSSAWFAIDVASIADQFLTTTSPFTVPDGGELRFWHSYNTENTYDGAVVEINSGGAWTDLGPLMTTNGYSSTISTAYESPIAGRSAFSGNSNGYLETVVDLSSYSSQSVTLRFRLGTDSSVGGAGWHVDDVVVSAGSEIINNEACVNSSEFAERCAQASTVVIAPSGVVVPLKLWLAGPYDDTLDQMSVELTGIMPSSQPYVAPELDGTPKDYDGAESSSIPNDMVDWLLVELRTSTASSSTVAKEVALLLGDGSVVGVNNVPLRFESVSDGSFYVIVRHRNHAGIMSANAVALSSTTPLYDMTTEAQVFGSNSMMEVEPNVFALWGGDGNADEQMTSNDFIDVWLLTNGTAGYLLGDFNLDGSATAFDFLRVFLPANGRASQIPN